MIVKIEVFWVYIVFLYGIISIYGLYQKFVDVQREIKVYKIF